MSRRTRIVATLGPATDRPGVLNELLKLGLDVARINFSHGKAEDHFRRIYQLRLAASQAGRHVAVLADLPGPKLRAVIEKEMLLTLGQEITFGATADIQVTEPEVVRDVQPEHRILLDDGRLQLRAVRQDGDRLIARVEVGGTLLPNKGINLPDTPLSIPALTPRDQEALALAARAGVDGIALSFVRSAQAAEELRSAAKGYGLDVPVLAKMERPEAVTCAAEIIDAFNGIMVARGDLGVEIPLERVPHVQKQLIGQARSAGKPVITATDMLDSMRHNPRPTRAEASDVANAIYDGTDAVMLSGETAVGDYPVEAVACMNRIVCETESQIADDGRRDVCVQRGEIVDHITHVTCALAREVGADVILTPTLSGRTARLVARHRPRAVIVAPAPTENVLRRMSLIWGVVAVPLADHLRPGEDRLEAAVRSAFAHGAVLPGQLAVVLAGHPIEGGDYLPTIRVVRITAAGGSGKP